MKNERCADMSRGLQRRWRQRETERYTPNKINVPQICGIAMERISHKKSFFLQRNKIRVTLLRRKSKFRNIMNEQEVGLFCGPFLQY